MAPCSCPSSVLCLLPSLLLLLQLPPGGSQEKFRVFGPTHPIVAELGKDATLPCSLYPAMSAEDMELRWFRSHFWESVFTYQDRQERHDELMAQYTGRTSLLGKYLSEGDAAVTIHEVRASDNGLYNCSFRDGDFCEQASLELQVVGVGSAPQVHITGPEEDGVCVVCMASGWFPEPQMQWRHPRGEQFLEFSKVHAQDTEGLFSVEAALVVRDSSAGSVTCSILNPILRQEKARTIVIPEPFFPRASPWKPAFLVSLPLLLLLLLRAAYYTQREHSTQIRELRLQNLICWVKELDLQTKEEALKDTDELQAILGQRKAAYLAAWRKAQLYADWRKEQFRACVGSAPQVHITGSEEDGVRVACTASGWFPEPQVQWRHPCGEQFLEFSKVYTQDTEGLFSVEAALVVRDSSAGSVTCSILNPTLSQEKAMAIVIPEPFFPRVSPWKLAFLVILPLLLLLLLGAACYTQREHSTQMRELQEQRNLHQAKEQDRQTKEEALKDTDELQEILGLRKAAYLAAWRKAQLYADWRKEQFRAWSVTLDPSPFHSNIVLSPDKKSMTCNMMA
ncbi:butyrophilin-like protein 2 [Talpa occidentalis]|uniref:butyrophilin-like protein 2 n=1 Tax=Talpa occidentalis TaxID=50954 RepID=UPI0023F97DB0|nr:butyrophilin-like protein 2 [Talpa occidentalis]